MSVKRALKIYAPYGLLAAVVVGPLLLPGYVLTLDAVFVPRLAAPATMGNDYLWQMFLHVVNFAVPSQVIEKIIFLGIMLGAAIGMHQLVQWLQAHVHADKTMQWAWATYFAGVFYAVNPFTYDRFMAGQYGVLLGYALLPFVVRWMLEFAETPGRSQMLRLALAATTISIISVPTLGEFILAVACILAAAAWQRRAETRALRLYALHSLAALGLFFVLGSYWLVPLALGKGAIAANVQQFTPAHTAAFATIGENMASKIAASLRLQGFWAEEHNLYVLPQERLPGWGTVRLAMWVLVAAGAMVCWRRSRRLAVVFLAIGAASTVLAAGLFATHLTQVGYREPQKFVGLTALAFAVFLAFGSARLLGAAHKRSDTLLAVAVGGILLLVLAFTPTMYWGFGGQLHPRQYPAGWFAANHYLNRQPGVYDTVFLPWHQYMSFAFSGRIIANPGARFFDRRVIISNDPELGAIQPPPPATVTHIGRLVQQLDHRPPEDLAAHLARYNVRYVLLAKDYDYQKYAYISHAQNLRLVQSTPTTSLYENMIWQGGK